MRLGSTLVRFDSLPSTNDLAREMAAGGADEGVAVLARAQTAGEAARAASGLRLRARVYTFR